MHLATRPTVMASVVELLGGFTGYSKLATGCGLAQPENVEISFNKSKDRRFTKRTAFNLFEYFFSE